MHPAILTVLAIHAAGLAALAIASGLQSARWAREDREQARGLAGEPGDMDARDTINAHAHRTQARRVRAGG